MHWNLGIVKIKQINCRSSSSEYRSVQAESWMIELEVVRVVENAMVIFFKNAISYKHIIWNVIINKQASANVFDF